MPRTGISKIFGTNQKDLNTKEQTIVFHVNGKLCKVEPGDVPATLSLARYVRDYLKLPGTKISCNQAGCGACVVTAEMKDPNGLNGWKTKSVNTCVTPVLVCDGWHITTVEGIGNYKEGLHPIQERLANFHGTQCGYCTPGMVMQMNSFMAGNQDPPKAQDIEDLFDGNICRCTGYRPILDAMKSFAEDADPDIKSRLAKLPDTAQRTCPISQRKCVGHGHCETKESSGDGCSIKAKIGSHKNGKIGSQNTPEGNWLFPHSMDELMSILKTLPDDNKYRLVAGNTGTGIYDHDTIYDTYIDILKIPELAVRKTTPELELGGGTNLHDFIEILEGLAKTDPNNYTYGKQFGIHLRKVAHTAVRHTGTIAGNLMLKHTNNWFPSDVFALLEGVGAKLVIKSVPHLWDENMYSPSEWLKQSMHKKVLLKIIFPKLNSKDYTFCSFKITPRRTNAHAYVNSAMKFCTTKDFIVSEKPTIVYGGITEDFVHAKKTEEYLVGKCIKDEVTLRGAMEILEQEIVPWEDPSEASPEYRVHLTKSLLYKTILTVLGDSVSSDKLKSAAFRELFRGCSKGKQTYPNFEENWPMYQPIPKIESKAQCSGEAEYIGDIPDFNGLLHCALVIADQGVGELDSVDPSDALKMPGVVAFIDHKDIPGKNDCQLFSMFMPLPPREILSTGPVPHVGQTIGAICAETPEQARLAARSVKISYKNLQKPVTYIRDAMKTAARVVDMDALPGFPPQGDAVGDVKEQEHLSFKTFEGELEIGSQHHSYMENLTHIVRPIENGEFEIYPTTQWMHCCAAFVAQVLDIQAHKVDVKVRRIGGSYGGKMSSAVHGCCVAAICANKLNCPVKLVMDLKTTMETYGKRAPYISKWKAGVTEEGKLTFVDMKLYCDAGSQIFENDAGEGVHFAQNVYNANAWKISPYAVVTDVMPNTYCRAPGSTQAHAAMEYIMERLAHELNVDPEEFRMRNVLKKGDRLIKSYGLTLAEDNPLPKMIHELKQSSNYLERKKSVDEFNKANQWIKKGMSLVPCKYYVNLNAALLPWPILISIYENDGSVAVTHGGIEMGQGINTKVAQVVASVLELPSASEVCIKPADGLTSANACVTGGSMASELVCQVAMKAAKELKGKLDEVEKGLEKACSWKELVKTAYSKGVDLTTRYAANTMQEGIETYNVWGAIITEVEVDMLTGEKNILRADLVEDTGSSLSPEVDIGQIEGAYIFGVGLWTSEEVKFHPETGKIITVDTWTYKPPMYQDIPEELNVTLYEGDRNDNQKRGVLGSKATGEPATHMGIGVAFAIRNAIDSVKKEIESENFDWYPLDAPATLEKIQLTSGVTSKHFVL